MVRFAIFVVALLPLLAAPAAACNDAAHTRLLKRQVEAQETQAKSMERQERLLRAQTKIMDQQRRARR
jgi:hypothetical protein